MMNVYPLWAAVRTSLACVVGLLLLLAGPAARAQAPTWQAAVAVGQPNALITATAADASGAIYLAGYFFNSITLGTTMLTSAGNNDAFVAKYQPATNTYTWAQQVGGTGYDQIEDLEVSGASLYVVGNFGSPTLTFGATTFTTSSQSNMFVAKLTDAGSTSAWAWAQRITGSGNENARAVAVSGSSVYLTGSFTTATLAIGPATLTNAGGSDVFVAKLTDAGSTGGWAWAQRAGGTDYETGTNLAVSGASVYVSGGYNSPAATFGPTTLTNTGSGGDVFVAKLTDAGSTSSFTWAQRAGGAGGDGAQGLVVNGSGLYVAGVFGSGSATFGSLALTGPGYYDAFVARLTDAGSTGSWTWVQQAGGAGYDDARALVASGQSLYVTGYFEGTACTFGPTTLTGPGGGARTAYVATLRDALLGTAPAASLPGLVIYPNPAPGAATVRVPAGAGAATVQVLDALGRVVRADAVAAGIDYRLAGLAPGLYAVRVQVGTAMATRQLAVE